MDINKVEGEKIVISGAREHNLKNVSVEIPRNKLVVISGLSGSGKSSLAFDTLFAEGQRRYMESFHALIRKVHKRVLKRKFFRAAQNRMLDNMRRAV